MELGLCFEFLDPYRIPDLSEISWELFRMSRPSSKQGGPTLLGQGNVQVFKRPRDRGFFPASPSFTRKNKTALEKRRNRKEWTAGLDGGPSIKALEKEGAAWRRYPNAESGLCGGILLFKRSRIKLNMIKRTPEEEAIDFYESMRGSQSLYGLGKMLKETGYKEVRLQGNYTAKQ